MRVSGGGVATLCMAPLFRGAIERLRNGLEGIVGGCHSAEAGDVPGLPFSCVVIRAPVECTPFCCPCSFCSLPLRALGPVTLLSDNGPCHTAGETRRGVAGTCAVPESDEGRTRGIFCVFSDAPGSVNHEGNSWG